MTDSTASNNPFPLEAVATYGSKITNNAKLKYVIDAEGELSSYLEKYPVPAARSGGGIAIQGGHGSGKTHLLAWLGQSARAYASIRASVAYVKCDSSNFFELYRQIFLQISRDDIIALVQLALLNLARDKALSVKVTESLAARLQQAGSLVTLQSENNIDLDQLCLALLGELDGSSAGPKEMARLLLDVPSPTIGQTAYEWFKGGDVADLSSLGIANPLRTSRDDAEGAGAIAISALEMIAALHRVAGVPMLILVDQLEVLLRTPSDAPPGATGSLIKKFVEQLGRQAALVFIAGTPDSWTLLPRDVPARFRRREPLRAGNLSHEEGRTLITAYLGERAPVSESTADAIHALSSGSPREILRISCLAWEATSGNMGAANHDILVKAAAQAGSIADQATLALAIADRVLWPFGVVVSNVDVNDSAVDRAVFVDQVVRLVLVVIKATDQLAEIDWYRKLGAIERFRRDNWPRAQLIAVSVGYSTSEVRDLFKETENLRFNEVDFEDLLRARAAMAFSSPPRADSPTSVPEPARDAVDLGGVENRLASLEAVRSEEARNVSERLTAETSKVNAPIIAERKRSARFEINDALDALGEAARAGRSGDERSTLRSILIANEAYLQNTAFEDLGNLYRELLDVPPAREYEDSRRLRQKLFVIRQMRDEISARSDPAVTFLSPAKLAAGAAIPALLAASAAPLFFIRDRHLQDSAPTSQFSPQSDLISQLPFVLAAVSVVLFVAALVVWELKRRTRLQARREFLALREQLIDLNLEDVSLRKQYPQA
jgi:hypothetical protein